MTHDSTPPDAASAGEPAATDAAALERLKRFGGDKLLDEMIALFIANAPTRIASARSAVDARDPGAAELAFHSLKASSAQLGAMRMQRISEAGERAAHAGDIDEIARLVTGLEQEYEQVHAWLSGPRTPVIA
ncbi:MAG: Hpt domain-containing protein [Gemmatimonadaceae bacterium]|nr:Hpt domain-containing protein [Gemmatimonadaceae bacterium]